MKCPLWFLIGVSAVVLGLTAQEAPRPAAPPTPTGPPVAPAPFPARPSRFGPMVVPAPPALGQVPPAPVPIDPATGAPLSETQAKRFDLDFEGGGPGEFIEAISKARGKPVNAIIPEDLTDTSLPAMHLKEVTLAQVFDALDEASRKTVAYPTGAAYAGVPGQPSMRSYQQMTTSFGFRTKGARTDHAIWCFYCDRPASLTEEPTRSAEAVRFFQLARYLDTFKAEDIMAAIQAGWQLGGREDGTPPKLTFLKETKLLLVRGTQEYLQVIDDVLKELDKGLAAKEPRAAAAPTSGK